jgi:hypothetical protein
VLVSILLLVLVLCGAVLAWPHLKPGPQEVSIHGTVTRDGKPLEWKGDERRLLVIFFPQDRLKNTEIYPAVCDADNGTFSITKIPTGKYTVAVQQNAGPLKDLLNLAFDPAHTTITRDVKEDGQDIRIDLPKDLPKASRPAMPPGRPDKADAPEDKPKSPADDKKAEMK